MHNVFCTKEYVVWSVYARHSPPKSYTHTHTRVTYTHTHKHTDTLTHTHTHTHKHTHTEHSKYTTERILDAHTQVRYDCPTAKKNILFLKKMHR